MSGTEDEPPGGRRHPTERSDQQTDRYPHERSDQQTDQRSQKRPHKRPHERQTTDRSSDRSMFRRSLRTRFLHARGRPRSACDRGLCVCHPFCRFSDDERAIEGLPVRLVIALVVGVASLSVMMSMIGGIQGLAVTELDVQPEPEVTTPGEQEVTIAVVAPDGDRIAGATVIVRAGSARLDGVVTARTDDSGVATVTIDPDLGPNQPDGTLTIDIKPPAGSDYVDDRENTRILVVED